MAKILQLLQHWTLQQRALFILFFLTGVLQSFPVIKDIDGWMLAMLHKAASIPDQVKFLAGKLYDSPYFPTNDALAAMQNSTVREVIEIANGNRKGLLERKVLNLLCLRNEI